MSFADHRCNVCGHWRYQRHLDPTKGCQGGTVTRSRRGGCRCQVCDYDTPTGLVATYPWHGNATPTPTLPPGATWPPSNTHGIAYTTCTCQDCHTLHTSGLVP